MKDPQTTHPESEAEEVAVLVLPPDCARTRNRAQEWARRLGLQVVEPEEADEQSLHLVPTEDGLELWAGTRRHQGVGRVDFARRMESGPGAAQQPLHRAIGKRPAFVIDATAGFGDDAIALAGFGHRVLALERSAVMAALLEDARERAETESRTAPIAERLRSECADACQRLPGMDPAPDVVYLDPMYAEPERKSRALPRIEIQLLRRLVGREKDENDLFDAALRSGARRIVVKRPIQAPPLREPCAAQHQGKLARYDVYDAAAFPLRPPETDALKAPARRSEK
ncbi:MAG: class I SAM-dependent methyltransferase [Myxococcota bacterium]|nr:class I SAM-dependent methyltransferase [Myxococcota bacterium]